MGFHQMQGWTTFGSFNECVCECIWVNICSWRKWHASIWRNSRFRLIVKLSLVLFEVLWASIFLCKALMENNGKLTQNWHYSAKILLKICEQSPSYSRSPQCTRYIHLRAVFLLLLCHKQLKESYCVYS